MTSRFPLARLGDRTSSRGLRRILSEGADSDALEEITRPLALLLGLGIWTGLRTAVHQPVTRHLLASATHRAGVVVQKSWPRELPTVHDYINYVGASFSLQLHMTDSRDAMADPGLSRR